MFSTRVMDNILTGLNQLADTLFERMPLHLSPDEFVEAYIRPHHVEPLRTTVDIVGLVGNSSTVARQRIDISGITGVEGEFVNLATHISFGGHKQPTILPQYIATHGIQNPGTPAAAKILAWAADRIKHGLVFADAEEAIRWLDTASGNAAAIRVMFPAITTIMSTAFVNGEYPLAERAVKLSQMTSFGGLPKISPVQRERLREVSSFINTIPLMRDAPVPPVEVGYTYFQLDAGLSSINRKPMFDEWTAGRCRRLY